MLIAFCSYFVFISKKKLRFFSLGDTCILLNRYKFEKAFSISK